jgi:CDP-diglyceride synthetase
MIIKTVLGTLFGALALSVVGVLIYMIMDND